MNSFIENLNQWGATFLGFAGPMLWQSSLLVVFVLALDFLLARKIRASVRYALWLVVLVKLCAPPTLALPTSPVWWLHKTPPPVVAKPAPHYTVTYDSVPLPEMPQISPPAFIPPKLAMGVAAWLLAVSSVMSLALLAWLLVRWWQIARQVGRAKISDRLAALADDTQNIIGIKFHVPVKLTLNSMSPAVCGLFRPAILIPQSLAEKLSDEQLRAVLLHELIHLRRRDVWVNFIQALLQIIYWWHPLVWVANARIRRVREEAVDDAVMLALRDEAESYAPTLLEVAKLALNRPLVSLGLVGIMESRHALRQRIERLVDFRAPRHAGLTLVSLLGILAFTAVAVPMGEGPVVQRSGDGVQVLDDSTNGVMSSGRGENKIVLPAFSAPTTVFQNTNPPQILIQAQIFRMRQIDFEKLIADPAFSETKNDKVKNFQEFKRLLQSSGMQQISSPRILTCSGQPAQLYVGSPTNSIEIECQPVVTSGLIDLASRIKMISTMDYVTTTNGSATHATLENGGGHVFSIKIADDMTGTNLVVVTVGVEIVTNTAHFQQRLQTIIQRAGGSQTNLVRGADRKAIVSKLDKIRLDHVSYDHLPLGEVLRQLAAEIKKRDPDKEGVNFLLQTAADTSANLPTVDPQTGLPATNTKPAGHDEINSVLITIPNLTDVRAADVLDAIVLTADKPIRYSIQDYAVFFSSKVAEIPQFFARTFRVNIATLRVGLKSIRLQQFGSNTNIDTDISTLSAAQVAREFFTGLGVDLKSPPGKSVFYNDRLGMLYVKATQSDLDIIERALSALMPPVLQIHIKARFVEVPKADSAGFDWYLGTLPAINSSNSKPNLFGGVFPGGGQPAGSSTEAGHITGILTDSNLNLVLHALNQRKAEFLAEPEVTTLSGRRTVIKATEDRSVITNMAYQEIGTNQNGIVVSNSILPQTERVEIGPILDCTATVLADGYTINLAVTPSLTEFAGYAKTTGLKIARNRAGEKIEVPEVFPIFRIRQATTDIKVMDDQTLVIGGMPEKFVTAGKGHESASNSSNKELLVFITATIVDQAGNRVHPDDSSGGIPPPPVPSK